MCIYNSAVLEGIYFSWVTQIPRGSTQIIVFISVNILLLFTRTVTMQLVLWLGWFYHLKHLKLANVVLIYKKGQKKDPGSYRPVSLTMLLGKVTEQLSLSTIRQHVQDKQGISPASMGL